MLTFLHSLFAFIIILVPLVVFHEFGHYIFARIFGVKAEIFSVGFGPKLWSRQLGETELRLSAIPLGGYVKLLGEERDTPLSEEDQKRALHKQAPWKRFFIFFGGPFFNFILAAFIFMVIMVLGEPQVASVVGRVVHHSPAEQAGFRSGDRILSIDGTPVKRFEEVITFLTENPNKEARFSVIHPGEAQAVEIQTKIASEAGLSMYGEQTHVGEIEGLLPAPRAPFAGVSNPASPSAKSGIQTGDRITSINGRAVENWEQLEAEYQKIPAGQSFEIKFKKKGSDQELAGQLKATRAHGGSLGEEQGLYSSELFVEKTVPDSPAVQAGLQAGDRILWIGHQATQSFFELKENVQRLGEKTGKVPVAWERNGQRFQAEIVPSATKGRDILLNHKTYFTIGIVPMLALVEPEMIIERIWNPFKLVYEGTRRMIVVSWKNLVSLRKMVTGDVSVGTLGGPIMIGKIAGESLARGIIIFLTNMAIFSVGLGVLNILPVPVLDGGHLMLLGIETIRGRPLTMRQMEIIQSVGLIFILALMGIAFRNDLARLIYS